MKHPWKSSDVEPLIELGLTKNQSVIYLTLLQRGILAATDLSRLTGVNRQQVYADTEKLIEHGLVDITRKQRKKFIAASPDALVVLANQRQIEAQKTLQRITQALPAFESLKNSSGSQMLVKYFEGINRIRDAYNKELECCKQTEVLSFVGSVDDLYQFFPESYWKQWNKRFVEQKNRSKMLVHYSEKAKETAEHDASYRRETRHINPFPLRVNVDIFGKTVLIVSAHDELAIWIESPIVAESYRILFQTCWSHAKAFSLSG